MAGFRRRIVREHPGVLRRRFRAATLAQISDPEQRARFERDFPESRLPALPKKRASAKRSDGEGEASVVNAVGDLLATHPHVLLAVRQNSGAMPYQGADGRAIPVWFYKLFRKPRDITLTDFWGFMRDGKPFAIECKRPDWKPANPDTKDFDREQKQRAFIEMIESVGGVGGFARSVDEAIQALLP